MLINSISGRLGRLLEPDRSPGPAVLALPHELTGKKGAGKESTQQERI